MHATTTMTDPQSAPMRQALDRRRLSDLPGKARLFAIAAIVWIGVLAATYRPLAEINGSLPAPDAVEYSVGAQRLATLGRFDIVVDGRTFPSRYPPGFSCILTPAYWVAPDALGAGIWICRGLWATGCAVLATTLASRLGIGAAGLTACVLTAHPAVFGGLMTIFSDVPCVAGLLVVSAVRLARPQLTTTGAIVAGLAVGVATACRPLAASFALPLLLDLRLPTPRRIGKLVSIVGPAAGVLLASATYNRVRFGSFGMNGYIFWCPVPYSALSYTFNPRYFLPNLASLASEHSTIATFAAGAAAAAYLSWRGGILRSVVVTLALAALPLTAVHLFYYFAEARLFLPLIVACTVWICLAVADVFARTALRPAPLLTLVLGVGVLGFAVLRIPKSGVEAAVGRWMLIIAMRDALPDDATIITKLDPVTLDPIVLRGTKRQWIAASRSQEYAAQVNVDRPISLDGIPRPAKTHIDHRNPKVFERGARFAVPLTAEDDAMLDRLDTGQTNSLFVDRTTLEALPTLAARLAAKFELRPSVREPRLVECVRRR